MKKRVCVRWRTVYFISQVINKITAQEEEKKKNNISVNTNNVWRHEVSYNNVIKITIQQ